MKPYKRGDSSVWWIGFRNAAGEWEYRSTGVKDERLAKRALEQIEAAIAKQERVADRPSTVASWAEKWATSRAGSNWTSDQDLGRLAKHVLPELGSELLVDVTRAQVRKLVHRWRDGGELATRTVRNITWAMSRMFGDAVAEGLLEVNPCALQKGDIPTIQDKDRRWRKTAVFTRAEAEQLFSDSRIPADHQVLWALGFLAALRLGEVAALRWRDLDSVREPLGCLSISSSYTRLNGEEKGTKTEVARDVPVHPTLAAILAAWKLSGWPELFGREPKDDDLVLPNRAHRFLNDNNVTAARAADFETLSLRKRRFHDARRTFISLAQADGALPHVLKLVTHGAPSEVMDLYTTMPWPKLCEAVGYLKLERRTGALRVLPTPRTTVVAEGDSTMQTDSATSLAQEGIRTLPVRHSSAVLVDLPLERNPPEEDSRPSPATERRNVGNRIPDLPARLRRLVAAYSKAGAR